MAIQKNSSGGPLSGKITRTAQGDSTADVKAVMRGFMDRGGAPQTIIEDCISTSRFELREILKVDDAAPDEVEKLRNRPEFEHPHPGWYLLHIIRVALAIKAAMKDRNWWSAIGYAVRLGRLSREYELLDFDRATRTGLGVTKGGQKGARSRDAGKAVRDGIIIDLYRSLTRSGLMVKQARAEIAIRLARNGVRPLSERQIRRIVRKERP